MRSCWRCHGDGSFEVNDTPNRDPQCGYDVRCDVCHGTGEIEDGVTEEELRQLHEGQVLDVTLIGPEHPLARYCKHVGATFRMRFDKIQHELEMGERGMGARPRPGVLHSPVTKMIWGAAIVDGTPEHYYHPPEIDLGEGEFGVPPSLRYGFHDWLVKEIEVVGD